MLNSSRFILTCIAMGCLWTVTQATAQVAPTTRRSHRLLGQAEKARDAMRRPITLIHSDIELQTLLDEIAQRTGVKIHANWTLLKYTGIQPEQQLSVRFKNVPAGRCLQLICRQISRPDHQIISQWRDHDLVIQSRDTIDGLPTRSFDLKPVAEYQLDWAQRHRAAATNAVTAKRRQTKARLHADTQPAAPSHEQHLQRQVRRVSRQIQQLLDPDQVLIKTGRMKINLTPDHRLTITANADRLDQVDQFIRISRDLARYRQPQFQEPLETFFSTAACQSMSQPVNLKVNQATLDQAGELIVKQTNLNVFIDWPNLQAAGIDRTTTTWQQLDLDEISAAKAVRFLIMGLPDGNVPLDAEIDAHGVLVITTAPHLAGQWRLYCHDLRPIIQNASPTARQKQKQQLHQIIQAVTRQPRPDIKRGQRDAGSCMLVEEQLLINTTIAQHRRIRRLFNALTDQQTTDAQNNRQTVTRQPQDRARQVNAMLAEPSFAQYEQTPWRKALTDTCQQGQLYKTFINWRAIRHAGVNVDMPVSQIDQQQTLAQNLNRLLTEAGRPANVELDYYIDDEGIVMISTAADLAGYLHTRVYDLIPIARRALTDNQPTDQRRRTNSPNDEQVNQRAEQMIQQLIASTQNDLPNGSTIHRFQYRLIVHGDYRTHRRVRNRIASLHTPARPELAVSR